MIGLEQITAGTYKVIGTNRDGSVDVLGYIRSIDSGTSGYRYGLTSPNALPWGPVSTLGDAIGAIAAVNLRVAADVATAAGPPLGETSMNALLVSEGKPPTPDAPPEYAAVMRKARLAGASDLVLAQVTDNLANELTRWAADRVTIERSTGRDPKDIRRDIREKVATALDTIRQKVSETL